MTRTKSGLGSTRWRWSWMTLKRRPTRCTISSNLPEASTVCFRTNLRRQTISSTSLGPGTQCYRVCVVHARPRLEKENCNREEAHTLALNQKDIEYNNVISALRDKIKDLEDQLVENAKRRSSVVEGELQDLREQLAART
ncbi:hypothetical protein L596_010875 [Steinernema carpocapsae]|uniref:Uncharacterized protein n=1 Tax=Steinernema carpocapsae TaxID=34508 RepID=A0A4U5PJS9_STECR|nr:hypothetical protein L596_010875 [Steinernema carpocapsae]